MRRLALVLALLVALCNVATARPSVNTGVSTYMYNPKIEEGLRLIDQGKYVKARELADEVFAKDPESFQSWYYMGLVMEYCDSNLPRAWFYLTGARQRLEKYYGGEDIPQDGPWWMHVHMLLDMADVAGQMEKFEEELELLRTYDKLYKPPHAAWYAWPLMKLGRYEEARAKIEQALRERPRDENSVTMAYNSLGAVLGEQEQIEESYKTFLKLIDTVKEHGWALEATYFYNAAEQAMELHKFREQEQLLIEATKHFDRRSYTNPYIALSTLYISAGRLGEALAAIRRMHQWSHDSEPRLEQQHWNEEQQVTAAGLLASGYDQDALSLMRRTMNRPDRRGGNSMKQDQTEIATLVFFREMLATEGERYNEHLSWCTWGDWFKLQAARMDNQREMWATTSRAASVIITNDRLVWSLRPYAIDSRIFEWMRPSLSLIMGEGVVSVECRKLLDRTDATGEREKPYLLATLGEADALRGYPGLALENLKKALETLPEAEVMLKARVTAVIAQCWERQGDFQQALSAYRQVMEKAPHMLREVGLALPVAIENDGTAAASTAAGWLRHSPRFNDVGAGFTIRVGMTADGVSASLLAADGTVFCTVTVKDQGDPKTTARLLCQEFHNKAFMPKLDLSQTDINSLDGSNETGDTNRDKLLQVFGVPGAAPSGKPAGHADDEDR